MKIFNLIKCEFIKNYTFKKILLIIVVLLISAIGIIEINNIYYVNSEYDVKNELDYSIRQYDLLKNKDEKTLEEQYYYNYYLKRIDMLNKMVTIDGLTQASWQYNTLFDILSLENSNIAIDLILTNDIEKFSDICNYSGTYYDAYEGQINNYCDKSKTEIMSEREKNQNEINKLTNIIDENKYYKLVEHLIETDKVFDDGNFQKIVELKIEKDTDYRVINIHQRDAVFANANMTLDTEEEFLKDFNSYADYYKDYQGYLRFNSEVIKASKEKTEIINYSINNNKKHDISFNEIDYIDCNKNYSTAKVAVNQIFNLSIVVVLLVILTSGGIISSEHASGIDKMLLTSPVKRWKVIISKFIYLILHTYIIWLIALFLLSIYGGIRYGFSELFTPKLIYEGGKVLEVNCYLYTIKNMLVAGIPVIAFISIMFALSTITLKTSITIGICTLLTCISPLLWYVISTYRLLFLAYTPFPYLDYGLVVTDFDYYLNALRVVNINANTGLIISLITIVIMIVLSTIVYVKRDIKN